MDENDKLRANISDFPIGNALRKDEAFKNFIKENFETAKTVAETKFPEAMYLWNLFENSQTKDYYNQAGRTEEKQRELFRSALVSTKIWILSAIITDSRPRMYLNPVFDEAGAQRLQEAEKTGSLPPWMSQGINEMGYEAFWNDLLDKKTDDWKSRIQFNSKLTQTVTKALCHGKAWVYVFQKNKEIYYENLPFTNVYEDPYANTVEQRRFLYYFKNMMVRDIELAFKLPKGDVDPEAELSGVKEEFKDISTEKLPPEIKYKSPQARVIMGIFKDESVDELGERKYPNGRIVLFLMNQDTADMTGIKILADYANQYSFWPIQDLILRHGNKETDGIPVARNLEPVDYMATKAIQQGTKNLHLCGNAYMPYEEDAIDDMAKLPADIVKIPVNRVTGTQFIAPPPLTQNAITW